MLCFCDLPCTPTGGVGSGFSGLDAEVTLKLLALNESRSSNALLYERIALPSRALHSLHAQASLRTRKISHRWSTFGATT